MDLNSLDRYGRLEFQTPLWMIYLNPKSLNYSMLSVYIFYIWHCGGHRLPSSTEGNTSNLPKRIIVRFDNRKFCDRLKPNRKKLKNIDSRHIGLESGKIYLNENLCPAYRKLWRNCRKQNWLTHWTMNGNVMIRIIKEGGVNMKVFDQDILEQKTFVDK